MSADARLSHDEVAEACGGDPHARRAVVERLGPMVLGLCRRLADDPEDAFQGVWERVFRALPRFEPQGSARLSTWVMTITHRHLLDLGRRRRRRGIVLPLPSTLQADGDTEAALLQRDDAARLDRALDQLPEELRRIVALHYLGELPLQVIAEQEALPVGTVKSRLHRARAKLASALGEP